MACYIASNNNRYYAALESAFGSARPWTAVDRCSGLKLRARQLAVIPQRKDKTGTRTYRGFESRPRRNTDYEFKSYVNGPGTPGSAPEHSAFFEAGLGRTPLLFQGGNITAATERTLALENSGGLMPGQAVVYQGEVRFVVALLDGGQVLLNAPFSNAPSSGEAVEGSVTYLPSSELKSLTLGDYWDPAGAVQRIITGAAVDELQVEMNGSFHQFTCKGPAQEVLDSVTFEAGMAGLTEFPVEPVVEPTAGAPIPGHIGQMWIGAEPSRLYTISDMSLRVKNNVVMRSNEFGSYVPLCFSAGRREVSIQFSLYERDDEVSRMIYQASRSRTPLGLMVQFGDTSGQLCGIWLKGFVPQVPEFDDDDGQLSWKFNSSQAQGGTDDEISIAFA